MKGLVIRTVRDAGHIRRGKMTSTAMMKMMMAGLHEKWFARQQKYCLDVGVVVRSG